MEPKIHTNLPRLILRCFYVLVSITFEGAAARLAQLPKEICRQFHHGDFRVFYPDPQHRKDFRTRNRRLSYEQLLLDRSIRGKLTAYYGTLRGTQIPHQKRELNPISGHQRNCAPRYLSSNRFLDHLPHLLRRKSPRSHSSSGRTNNKR